MSGGRASGLEAGGGDPASGGRRAVAPKPPLPDVAPLPAPRRALVVFNPSSGRRRSEPVERLCLELVRRGVEVQHHVTRGPGDAIRHLRDVPGAADLVVAAGGDGTVSEVVNGLEPWSEPRLGVFPTGTTNVLARELSLPADPVRAADSFVAGRMTVLRPGRVGERRFVLWVGAGFDAAVVAAVDLALKRRVGRVAYLLAALRQLPSHGRTTFTVRGEREEVRGSSVLVTRVQRYAGPFRLTEEAGLADPELRALVIRSPRRVALLRHALGLLLTRLDRTAGIESLSGPSFELSASHPGVAQVDGDPGPALPLALAVEERELLLAVPADRR